MAFSVKNKVATFIYFVLCLGLGLQNGYAQKPYRIEVFYDDEQKMPKEVFYVSDTLSMQLNGEYKAFFTNGKLKEQGQYRNDTATGQWSYFYETGQPKMKGELKNGSNWGEWLYYYENGLPSMQGPIYDGKRQGDWTHYYENGSIKRKGRYLDNKPVGIWNYFYESASSGLGSLKAQAFYENGVGTYKEFYPDEGKKAEGLYIDGKSEGEWTYYYKNGKKEAEGFYQDGVRSGKWVFYHQNGKIEAVGEYQNGVRQGEWKYYNDNGTLSSKGQILDDKKEGSWQVYDQFGEFKGEGNFLKGEGEYKEYYENGRVKTVGQISNDKFEGEWLYFFEDGRLEGKAQFTDGKGYYYGYYPDGALNMEGEVENGKRTGTWKMYDPDGNLSGYYKVYYENNQPVYQITAKENTSEEEKQNYELPNYRFPTRGFRYFRPQINEFKALIIGTNPLASLMNNWPLSVEYYIQERLGYELRLSYIRNPFYQQHKDLIIGEEYYQGFSVALRQKFYQPDNKLGMVWFGHELRGTPLKSTAIYQDSSPDAKRATSSVESIRLEYSILVGDRISESPSSKGWTVDFFAGLGIGYQFAGSIPNSLPENSLTDERENRLTLPIRLGVSFGYAFDRIK